MKRWPGYAIFQIELRSRFRGWGIILVLSLYLLALVALLVLGLVVLLDNQGLDGESLFLVLLGSQFVLLCVIGPLSSCGGISMEHERNSFELVITTLLRPVDIWTGKLASAMALGWVLFACGLPMILFCTFIGGVSPWKFLFGYAFLLVVYLCYCTFALWVSCMTKRTMVSMNIVTVALAVINGLFPFVYMIVSEVGVLDQGPLQAWVTYWGVMMLSPLLFVEGWLTDTQMLPPGTGVAGGYSPDIILLAVSLYLVAAVIFGGLTLRRLRFPRV